MRLLNSSIEFLWGLLLDFQLWCEVIVLTLVVKVFLRPSPLTISSTVPKLVPLLTLNLGPITFSVQVFMIGIFHFASRGGGLRTVPSLW